MKKEFERYGSKEEDLLDLSEFFLAILRRRWIVIGVLGICLFVGVLYAVLTTPVYTSSVTTLPLTEEGGVSGLAGQFAGAAAFAGIDLGGGGSQREEYIAVLTSRGFLQRFISDNDLKKLLFPERWDAESEVWKDQDGGLIARIRGSLSSTIAALSGDLGWRDDDSPVPSDWDAVKVLRESFHVREDSETGLVYVSFSHENPELAARWANSFITQANNELRANAIQEASNVLGYLQTEVEKTTVSGLRETIYRLIETQLETVALANARPEYAFKVLDAAVVPQDHSKPNRPLAVILSFLIGGILGSCVAIALEARRGAFRTGPIH